SRSPRKPRSPTSSAMVVSNSASDAAFRGTTRITAFRRRRAARVVAMGSGLMLASLIQEPWQLYLSLGALVGGGVNLLAYTVQSLYLTSWFVRRRGLAMSIAFSGVGIGSVTILPWLQSLIAERGWRTACWSLGLLVLIALAPLNLLLRRKPADLGLEPDGGSAGPIASSTHRLAGGGSASVDWTLPRALRARRF